MTATELKNEAQKKAQELMLLCVRPVKDMHGKSFPGKQKQAAMACVKQMLEEHSCYTLNDGRWAFWAQVEIELNAL